MCPLYFELSPTALNHKNLTAHSCSSKVCITPQVRLLSVFATSFIKNFDSSSPRRRMATDAEKRRCLQFSGEDDDFAYWSEKFEGSMHVKKLRQKLLGDEVSNADEKYNIWAEMVQSLDKRSIMMLKSECKGDGPEAWKRLQAHFSSSVTPRVMNLLEQLTSLSLNPSEEMTDYLIRAETLSSSLEVAGEKISEKLLVSVVLKGLPDSFEYFHNFSKTPTLKNLQTRKN